MNHYVPSPFPLSVPPPLSHVFLFQVLSRLTAIVLKIFSAITLVPTQRTVYGYCGSPPFQPYFVRRVFWLAVTWLKPPPVGKWRIFHFERPPFAPHRFAPAVGRPKPILLYVTNISPFIYVLFMIWF